MTPNKLPPLPDRVLAFLAKHDGWGNALDYVEKLEHAYAAEALRQSQSLPAGAVAELVGNWSETADRMESDGFHEEAGAISECKGQLEQALQADAREKGEAVPAGWKVIRLPDGKFPDLMIVRATSGDESEVIQGDDRLLWDYFAAVAATQPAQASEAAVMAKVWRNQYVNERTQHHRRIDEPYEIARAKAEAEANAFEDEFLALIDKRAATSSQETSSE